MLQSLPTSVRELSLFETALDDFSPVSSLFGFALGSCRSDSPSLGLSLARTSRQLQHLSASFATDAKYFFQPFWPPASDSRAVTSEYWAWSRLETVALTSQLLRCPQQPEDEVNYLLEAASMAVRRMPKLRTLEIWSGNGIDHACLFRYSYDPNSRRASLTWKGTWEIEITQRTANCWDETVRQKTGLGTAIRFEKLELDPPFMIEAVALFLDLRDRVATDRVSRFLPQISCSFYSADSKSRH